MFRDLATAYYSLLLTYRAIEIDTQDYFSNTRGFNQAEAEYRAGRLPRFQVDQFEQNSLSSRSSLITSSNSLETGLDRLKLQIGLPTETPINLNLDELEQLTLRDEARASAERVRRARRNLLSERQQSGTARLNLLLNAAISLARRMQSLEQLRRQADGGGEADSPELDMTHVRLSVSESRWRVRENRAEWEQERRPSPYPSCEFSNAPWN